PVLSNWNVTWLNGPAMSGPRLPCSSSVYQIPLDTPVELSVIVIVCPEQIWFGAPMMFNRIACFTVTLWNVKFGQAPPSSAAVSFTMKVASPDDDAAGAYVWPSVPSRAGSSAGNERVVPSPNSHTY